MPARSGLKAIFYIEPKPKEPTKHQYDFDAATVLASCAESASTGISS